MISKLVRGVFIPAAALALVAVPGVAQATTGSIQNMTSNNQGIIACQLPLLRTGFGDVAQCSKVSGTQVTFGFFSPITKDFNPNSGPHQLFNAGTVRDDFCPGSDGNAGSCIGKPSVNSNFGALTRATQYQASRGRVGWYSLLTGQFSPDTPNGGWSPIVP